MRPPTTVGAATRKAPPIPPTDSATVPGAAIGTPEPTPDVTASPEEVAGTTFADLGVLPETVEALAAGGITHPFAIQALTLPIALAGNDVIGQARTGTGKTLGFGIPLLQRVTLPSETGTPQALVVVPTRELCIQVASDIEKAGSTRGVRVLSIYGGRSYEPQVEALRRGIEVVVGTPGRLLDLAQQGHLRLGDVRMLVLDEADEMLDLGFLPDVERILERLPGRQQTMLFSATMPGPVVTLARRFMTRPTHVRAEMPDEGRTVPTTSQHVFRAHALDKVEMLARLLQAEGRGLTMVFCRTKRTCDKVAAELADRGFAAAAVHGDLGQGAREQALRAFRSGKIDVLVATDVAARGIDVAGVTHVVNYQCPEDEKVYLHRIGRTGRAGGSGTAVTFVDWDDIPRWQLINNALELPFPDPAETYSSSPHFFESLDIPVGAKGTLPRAQRTRAGLDAEEVEDLGETGGRGRKRAASGTARDGGRRDRDRDRDRGRSTADDDRGERVERAPLPADAATDTASTQGETSGDDAPPRRSRARRRTRGGEPQGGPTGAEGTAGEGSAPATGPAAGGADSDAEGDGTRRRRRRGGRGRGRRGTGEAGDATEGAAGDRDPVGAEA